MEKRIAIGTGQVNPHMADPRPELRFSVQVGHSNTSSQSFTPEENK